MPPDVPVPRKGPCPGSKRGARKLLPGPVSKGVSVVQKIAKPVAKAVPPPQGAAPAKTPKKGKRLPGASRLDEVRERATAIGKLGTPTETVPIKTGEVADVVEIRTYPSGARTVYKKASDHEKFGYPLTAKHQADAEELASLVGASLGLNVGAVRRRGQDATESEFLDGDIAVDLEQSEGFARFSDIPIASRARIGLFDALIDNLDRHRGNFMFTPSNEPGLIDHGLAWQFARGRDGVEPDQPPKLREFGSAILDDTGFKNNLFTAADMAAVRERLEALRPEFERLGRADWLDGSLTRLEQIARFARGRKDLIG